MRLPDNLANRSHLQIRYLEFGPYITASCGKNLWRFPRPRWTVEEKVGKPALFGELLDQGAVKSDAFSRVGGGCLGVLAQMISRCNTTSSMVTVGILVTGGMEQR